MAEQKYSKQKGKRNKKSKKASVLSVVLSIILFVIVVVGYYLYDNYKNKNNPIATGELSFHFLTLGNATSGDCIYIKAGDNDILIDAGSAKGSINSIKNYFSTNNLISDGKLEYVIATHYDTDHIACFGIDDGIFDSYQCEIIIDSPKTIKNDSDNYKQYVESRDKEISLGAKHYSSLDCAKNQNNAQRIFNLTDSITMEILYNSIQEPTAENPSKENDLSVCVLFSHGSKKFLFTGDLEENGEKLLIANNNLGQVDLYKAGHHGSDTSSTEDFLKVIQPKICVIPCVANDRYNFPKIEPIKNFAKYTDKVYLPIYKDDSGKLNVINGNIIVSSSGQNELEVCCDGTSDKKPIILKETKWFIDNREMPNEWRTI